MLRTAFIFLFLIFLAMPSDVYAEVKVKQLLLMSPEDIVNLLETEKGEKVVYLLTTADCLACHKKFVSILRMAPEERERVTVIFMSEKTLDFKRYVNSFNEIPLRIIYNRGSAYELARALKQYGVKPWVTLPRVILFDENLKVFGQGAHTADKISIFLSDQEPVISDE